MPPPKYLLRKRNVKITPTQVLSNRELANTHCKFTISAVAMDTAPALALSWPSEKRDLLWLYKRVISLVPFRRDFSHALLSVHVGLCQPLLG